jgi:arylsulfatase A-like enzyme/Flp pilus assembly protein TadD
MVTFRRSSWLPLVFFSFAFLISRASPSGDQNPKKTPLNVLLITIDTLRADRLSCYGSRQVKTPNIDGLAEKGVLFSRAFAHTPETLPSHTNILLGTTPLYHGVHDNHNFIVRPEFLNLALWLKDRGYSTAAFVGAFPLDSRFGLTSGFDVYDDDYGVSPSQEFSYVERKAEVVVQRALAWLENQKGPWFLWVHCFDPHQRYDPPEPFKTEFRDHPYDGEVAYVDLALGKLLDFVGDSRFKDSTLTVLTADHGESLGEHGESTHGYFAYNSTLWVPLIMDFPGIAKAEITQYVSHIDIFPTVCDVLGLEKPSHLQGLSLLPIITGKKLPDRGIYFESLYPFYSRGWAPLRGTIQSKIKFIDSPIPEVYDLDKDFQESENIARKSPLEKYKTGFDNLVKIQSYSGESAAQARTDRATREKLESLGYVSSPQAPRKGSYSPQDDLKTLLPFQNQLMQAMAAYHKGDYANGVALLKEVIDKRKDFDLAYTYLATIYKEQRRYKDAVDVLREGHQNCPASYKVKVTLGNFLSEAGQYDRAIAILKEGLAIMDYDPELWNYLGVAYWRKGSFDDSLKAYDQALSLAQDYPVVINNLGSLYLSIFLATKKPEAHRKAVENFKRAIDLDPEYESPYNGLGAALKMAGDLDGAISYWKRAVALRPDFSFSLYNLGLALLQKGDKGEALAYLTRYKEGFYRSLSPQEQNKLDALIEECKKSL